MSTPDQPSTPPLTRRQLRELRNTGATPVVAPTPVPQDEAAATDAADEATAAAEAPVASPEPEPSAAPSTPLPRAAEPVDVHTAPVPDSAVDLGAAPLTRRQARQQERIRTASVPVISPDLGASAGSPASASAAASGQTAQQSARVTVIDPSESEWASTADEASATQEEAPVAVEESPVDEPSAAADAPAEDVDASAEDLFGTEPEEPQSVADAEAPAAKTVAPAPDRAVLNPLFGAGLLAGEAASTEPAASFEQLLTRDIDTTGSVTAPSALIMSHASAAPLVGPIGGTGEVLVTGTFALPEGLGSTGHALGAADGKEIDAVLVDGELPAHSSPTPIAASAAVSTIKSSEDVIQPPAPEKGGKLMLTLAITAGVLALALVGVLVYALATGVIS